MKTAVKFLMLIGILALFSLVITDLAPTDHPPSKQQSHWVGGVYGSVEVWGLRWNHPRTQTSHHVSVSNESGFKARYLYEFKHSILERNHEVKIPPRPAEVTLKSGKVFMRTASLGVNNLENLGIRINDMFTVSAYSRVEIHARGASRSWKVELMHRFN